MPRGVKKERNYNEEITQIESKLAEYDSKIKALKSELTSLKKAKEQHDLHQLNKLISESGLSVDEVAKLIKKP